MTLQNQSDSEQLKCVRLELLLPGIGTKSQVFKGEDVIGYTGVPQPIVVVTDHAGGPGRRRMYVGIPFIATEEPSSLVLPRGGLVGV